MIWPHFESYTTSTPVFLSTQSTSILLHGRVWYACVFVHICTCVHRHINAIIQINTFLQLLVDKHQQKVTQLTLCFQGQTKGVRPQTTEKGYSDDMSYTEVQDSASIFFVPSSYSA